MTVFDAWLTTHFELKEIAMRELTLLDTGCLAGLLLLSLVLPLLVSLRCPRGAPIRETCMKTVWTGQALLVVAAFVVLASPTFAPYAALFGLADCCWCALLLRAQLRLARRIR